MGCKRGHVGHHHHDVARLQLGLRIKPAQDAVVQHLDLALCRMGLHKGHAGVVGNPGRWRGRRWVEVEQIGLQLLQHGGTAVLLCGGVDGVDEHIDALKLVAIARHIVKAIQQVQVVAPVFAPGRQQRVAVGVQQVLLGRRKVVARQRQIGFVALPATAPCGQGPAAVHHMAPKILTGVLHQHQHLTHPAQSGQGLHCLHGQRCHAKDHQALWHTCGAHALGQLLQRFDKGFVHVGPRAKAVVSGRVTAQVLQQVAPQRGLPMLRSRQGRGRAVGRAQAVLACGPIVEPVGAVVLVTVQHVGQLQRQLVGAAPRGFFLAGGLWIAGVLA